MLAVLGLVVLLATTAHRAGGQGATGGPAVPLPASAGPVAMVGATVPVAEQERRAPVSRGAQRAIELDPVWVAGVSDSTGIPAVAVEAYGGAALRVARERPGCHLGWTTLAAIGRVESEHGTIGGRTLRSDGRTSTPVIGPALDGGEFAAIPAGPGSTRMHGDSQWDHAVGPLQFIPSTWERWRADGNDDDRSDPHNIFDAGLAAARYLCASGADLTTGEGWGAAVLSYNHSQEYVASVLSWANHYAGA